MQQKILTKTKTEDSTDTHSFFNY